MRLLKRNVTEFEYLANTGTDTDVNSDGEHTGHFVPAYAEPEVMQGNISTPSGNANHAFYGQDIRYTHILVMDTPEPGIEETGKIRWKGETYDILAVRPSLNAVSIALRRQTRNHAEADEMPQGPTGATGATGSTGGEGA